MCSDNIEHLEFENTCSDVTNSVNKIRVNPETNECFDEDGNLIGIAREVDGYWIIESGL